MVVAAYLGMRTGRPKKPLEIVDADREKLSLIARRPKSAQAMALRARIVLSCGQGMSNSDVARKLHITGATVGKWRERYRESGLDGLLDEPRVGAPRKITDQQIEDVITKTLESMPANSTHWSTRLMAQEAGLTQNAIVRIWRAFGLQPHRVENFKFSKDPQFVEKVRDIVGLYLNPPDRAIVLCVDEKSQVQALNRTQPILPLAPGVPVRQSHDYERHGVTSLFAAMDVASGVTISTCYRRHRHQEFLRFLDQIEANLPTGFEVGRCSCGMGLADGAIYGNVLDWLLRRRDECSNTLECERSRGAAHRTAVECFNGERKRCRRALPTEGRFMYQPHVFREEHLETLHSFIQAHPLATLITTGFGGLLANLVPFTLVDGGERERFAPMWPKQTIRSMPALRS